MADNFNVLDTPILIRTSATQLETAATDSLLVYGNAGIGALLLIGADGIISRVATQTLGTPNILEFTTAGRGVSFTEGSNAIMGTATLNGASEVTVSTTAVTANSRIFLCTETPGGTPSGQHWVSSRSAGASFGITSVSGDTSTVAWLIFEPA